MPHVPEELTQYVCENCQVTHAGTPIHHGPGDHSFEPPDRCGACGESRFLTSREWIRHHD